MDDGDDFSILGNCAASVSETLGPNYSTNPKSYGANLSCSAHSDFCYLCTYMDSATANSLDLKGHIQMLLDEGKELPSIVTAVIDIYNNELRADCYDSAGNRAPEWKPESVARHLLHTNREVFSSYTESVLQHLIVRQAEAVVNTENKRVNHEERSALLQSIDALARWKQRCKPARKRPATSMD